MISAWLAVAIPPGYFASAQSNQVQITSLVTSNWPAVEATVTVIDASGQPVAGLNDNNFASSVDGTTVPLTGVTTTSDPSIGIAVVLVFDVSGSMAGPPLEEAKAAGKTLLAQLGATDQVAVMSFATQPAVVQDYTSDRAALERAIDSLSAEGATALYAGVQDSAALAAQAPLPRRAVVLLSDGVDEGSTATATRESSLAAAADSGALIMTVGLGPSLDDAYLSELATLGKGQYLSASQAAELQALYSTIGGVLRQQYVLTLDGSALGEGFSQGTLRVDVLRDGARDFAETALVSPVAPASLSPTPVLTATPAPTDVPGVPGDESGSSLLLPLIAGGAAVALVLGVPTVLLLRRRRSSRPAREEAAQAAAQLERLQHQSSSEKLPFPEITRAVPAEETGAWLELPAGGRFNLTTAPITVGFSADCTIRLDAASFDSLERVRIWLRDGRYMLHNLSRSTSIGVGGRPVTWVILEDGDALQLGSATLVFHEPAGI
jgi:VWFA-related protein